MTLPLNSSAIPPETVPRSVLQVPTTFHMRLATCNVQIEAKGQQQARKLFDLEHRFDDAQRQLQVVSLTLKSVAGPDAALVPFARTWRRRRWMHFASK